MKPQSKERVLRALLQGDNYGLGLLDMMRQLELGRVGQLIYPLLREMENEGLVTSYEGEALGERGGRPRRYYKLTDAGRSAVEEIPCADCGKPVHPPAWPIIPGSLRCLDCGMAKARRGR